MKRSYLAGVITLSIACACAGWFAHGVLERGEIAMSRFMTDVSVLAYLNKGDVSGAMGLLRVSAEAHMLIADEYGDWGLKKHDPDAMAKWFVDYARLRATWPAASAVLADKGYDRKIDTVLQAAAARLQKPARLP